MHGGYASAFSATAGVFESVVSASDNSGFLAGLGTLTIFPAGYPRAWYNTTAYEIGTVPTVESGLSNIPSPTIGNTGDYAVSADAAYVTGNHYVDTVLVWGAGAGNRQDIRSIALYKTNFWGGSGTHQIGGVPCAAIAFEEPQRKDATHKLTLTVRRAVTRDLTLGAS